MIIFIPLLILAVQLHAQCPPTWTFYKKACYHYHCDLHIRGNYDNIRQRCISRGGDLASGATLADRRFFAGLATDNILRHRGISDYPLLGMHKDRLPGSGQLEWRAPNNSLETFEQTGWCRGEPSMPSSEFCIALIEKPASFYPFNQPYPCMLDFPCAGDVGGWARYFCRIEIKCPANGMEVSDDGTCRCKAANGLEASDDGTCRCKAGFIDMKDAHIPEQKKLKIEERCLPRTPCKSVKDSLSIVFVIDSSKSIGSSNWKKMVRFLESGADLLDNSMHVGFVKFSTNVTSSEWLPDRWTKSEYIDWVPAEFDAGYTNTPAALDAALKLFEHDRSKHKVAILITDGMPYVPEVLPKDDAMPKTKEAVKRLQRARIQLVTLGYGEELRKYGKYLREILRSPERDYFELGKEARDLKDIHMTILLNKVCERF